MAKKKRKPNQAGPGFKTQFRRQYEEWEADVEERARARKEAREALGDQPTQKELEFSDQEAGEIVVPSKKKKKAKKKEETFEEWSDKQRKMDRKPLGVKSKEDRRKALYEAAKKKRKNMTAEQLKAKTKKDALKSQTIRRGTEENYYNRGGKSTSGVYEENNPDKYKKGKESVQHLLDSREKWDETKKKQDKEWKDKTRQTPGGLRFMKKVKKKMQDRP